MDIKTLFDRMVRASKLEVDLYEEVEADTGAIDEAMTVVVLSSLAAGLGYAGRMGLFGVFLGTIGALVGWVIWAYITYLVGTKLLPVPQTESDMGELLRTIGYASSPGVIRLFGALPGFGPLINFVVGIWMLVAMVIGVRQALDYESTGRAIGVCVIGWLVQIPIFAVLYSL